MPGDAADLAQRLAQIAEQLKYWQQWQAAQQEAVLQLQQQHLQQQQLARQMVQQDITQLLQAGEQLGERLTAARQTMNRELATVLGSLALCLVVVALLFALVQMGKRFARARRVATPGEEVRHDPT